MTASAQRGRRTPPGRTRRLATLLLAAAALAAYLYWQGRLPLPRLGRDQGASGTTPTVSDPRAGPVASPQALAGHDPLTHPASALADLRRLRVAPEFRCAPYNRDDYRYSQAVEDVIIAGLGDVYGPYTGQRYSSKYATDIEHMIAISEAHDSGLCAADGGTRRAFAGDPLNLTLASPTVNRDVKKHFDAAEWLPPRNQCWFAGRVVAVRKRYGLTVDQAERNALEAVLSRCTSLLLEKQ